MSEAQPIHVVIVGGGFAGVGCAKRLAGELHVRVTLIDKNGYHQFQPLIYQVATAELIGDDIAFKHSDIFEHHHNIDARQAEVTSIDPHARSVNLADGSTVAGDVLVLTAGADPEFFHVPGAEEHAYPLYSLADARRVRARVIQIFQDVAANPKLIDEGALNFVIVGAGPTGVEFAGALSELIHDVMPKLYGNLDVSLAKVIVVDRGHAVLNAFSESAHAYAAKQLDHREVKVLLGSGVTEVARDHVKLEDGSTVATHLTVWGGGEKAAPVIETSGVDVGHGGRVTVDEFLQVPGFPGVYAAGDAANVPDGHGGVFPQLGSVAQQSGDWVGRNILAEMNKEQPMAFRYHDKGIMAMIGRRAAVAEIGEHRHELHGRVAFAAWLGVHAALLSNIGAETHAFMAWAEDFYVRPHHRSAALLNPDQIDAPRIKWARPPSAPPPDPHDDSE
jgi:NADH dehydrogenase